MSNIWIARAIFNINQETKNVNVTLEDVTLKDGSSVMAIETLTLETPFTSLENYDEVKDWIINQVEKLGLS